MCPVCSANTMQNFFFTKLVSVGIEYIKKKKRILRFRWHAEDHAVAESLCVKGRNSEIPTSVLGSCQTQLAKNGVSGRLCWNE